MMSMQKLKSCSRSEVGLVLSRVCWNIFSCCKACRGMYATRFLCIYGNATENVDFKHTRVCLVTSLWMPNIFTSSDKVPQLQLCVRFPLQDLVELSVDVVRNRRSYWQARTPCPQRRHSTLKYCKTAFTVSYRSPEKEKQKKSLTCETHCFDLDPAPLHAESLLNIYSYIRPYIFTWYVSYVYDMIENNAPSRWVTTPHHVTVGWCRDDK